MKSAIPFRLAPSITIGTKIRRRFGGCSILLVLALLQGCNPAPEPVPLSDAPLLEVTTQAGQVRGRLDGPSVVFKGVPYAAPPVGELRWQPPRVGKPWGTTLDAADFGAACPQADRSGELTTSENCLTLNLWTPADASSYARLPVMVWIHGGGFRGGASSAPGYNGANFAREDVLLVSINYRLGALGFFAHPLLAPEDKEQAWANYGLMDMVAALQWVKRNIAGFGGDPQRVTIFGESAGGMAIQMLTVSPAAKGLFSGAIAMSGYGTWPLPRAGEASATDIATAIAQRASGGADIQSAAELRELSVEDLTGAVLGLHLPIVDGVILPEEPAVIFANQQQHHVPLIAGGDDYDGAIMGMAGMDTKEFLDGFNRTTSGGAARVRQLYEDDFAVSDDLGISRMFGDNRYLVSSRFLAKQMSKAESPAYLYYYTFVPEARRGEWPGAPHGSELGPLFGLGRQGDELDAESAELGVELRRRFISFAQNGDPNADGLAVWPSYNQVEDEWLVVGQTREITQGVAREKLDYLESLYLERIAIREVTGD